MYVPYNPRRPSLIPRLLVTLVVSAVGLVLLGSGALAGSHRFADPFTAPYQSGTFNQHLLTGTYLVFSPDDSSVRGTPAQLRITAPDHTPVAVTAYRGDDSQTRGGKDYTAYAQFHSSVSGNYNFSLAANGSPRVIVARSVTDSIKPLVRPAITVVVGGLLTIIGLTLFVRTFTHRGWLDAPPLRPSP